MRSIPTAAFSLSFGLLMLTSCSSKSGTTPVPTPAATDIWVVAWGESPESALFGAENPGGAEQTFRSFFYPTVAGTMERVRFSNYFGAAPITIGAARLAIAATPQGRRILVSEYLEQVFVVPSSFESFSFDSELGGFVLLEQVERDSV